MIISASRRTDIPNYYSDWFLNRIKEGYVYIRNPFNAHQVSKVDLSLDVVDCIVFWTKNPKNMLGKLDRLDGYNYYFQFTLTGYGKDVERGLPDKRELIDTFQELSKAVGPERVIWRYDPILINDKYNPEYHLRAFKEIASSLQGHTEKCVISFVDMYAKSKRNMSALNVHDISDRKMLDLACQLFQIAASHDIVVESCAESVDLRPAGVQSGCCIDKNLIERIIGIPVDVKKDASQRPECGCVASIDIGAYNTCLNGCLYCYANFSDSAVKGNLAEFSVESPLLCGSVSNEDKVTERKVKSLKEIQGKLF